MLMLKGVTLQIGVPCHIFEEDNLEYILEMIVEHNPKIKIPPLKKKKPPPFFFQNNPHSCQTTKDDCVDNKKKGQTAPSQQLKKDHLHKKRR